MGPARTTFRTILHPNFKPINARRERVYPELTDYVRAPRLEIYGTFRVLDLIDPRTGGNLARLANELESASKRNHGR